MGNLIMKVREVKEVTDIDTVNSLVEKDWILLKIVPNKGNFIYALGKTSD